VTTMDSQTLERLILDQALGALSPDCATLLENYLATHAEAAALAREMSATASLARKALAEPVPGEVPEFAAEVGVPWPSEAPPCRRPHSAGLGMPPVGRFARPSGMATWAKRISGIAAAVLVGFGAHAFLYDGVRTEPAPMPRGTAFVSAVPRTTGDTDAGREGFWSARRLYERTAQGGAAVSEKVIWDSPVRVRRAGDQT